MDLEKLVISVLVLGEKNAPAFQPFHHLPAARRHPVVDRLVHDAFAGHAVGFDIKLRRGLSRNGHDVQGIHPAGDTAAVENVPLFEYDHLLGGIGILGPDGSHGARAPPAEDQNVGLHVGLSELHKNPLKNA